MSVRVRFAPSPTGLLHVGNVRTALFNWLFARKNAGTFILRVEDTDVERSESQYEDQLVSDLRWLGLEWEEGFRKGGPYGPYRQTERFRLYREFANRLLEDGSAYYCFCSPEQLEKDRTRQQKEGSTIQYVGRCRNLPQEETAGRLEAGEEATIRLKVRPGSVSFDDLVFGPIQIDTSTVGDFILLRSDGSAQYNLACVVDDALMKISHVIRGEGHMSNTHRQLLIYEALDLRPPSFAHLSTILGPDGSKLSKRHGATSIREFQEVGYLPEAAVNYLALLGWSPENDGQEILTIEELIEGFSLSRVNLSPATFDINKFNWVNRSHLKKVEPSRLIDLARPKLKEAGLAPEETSPEIDSWLEDVIGVLTNYIDRLSDLTEEARVLSDFSPEEALECSDIKEILEGEGALEVVNSFNEALQASDAEVVDFEIYKHCVVSTQDKTGKKGKLLFRPIRVAVTARASGPELDKLLPLIELGSRLKLPNPILGVRERVSRMAAHLTSS